MTRDERHRSRAEHVIGAIDAFNARLSDPDRSSKYGKLAASPSSFFRGTNHLFWHDLAGDARFGEFGESCTRIWLQGDAHAGNIGAHADSEGTIVYDLNDFDDSVIADYQWDVWRLATSIALLAGERGLVDRHIDEVVNAFAGAYLDTVSSYHGNDDENDHLFTLHDSPGALGEFLRKVGKKASYQSLLDKWTIVHEGVRCFDLAHEDLAAVDQDLRAALTAQLADYAAQPHGKLRAIPGYFTVLDIARRLHAGTGSLGRPRYYVLIQGKNQDPDAAIILDVKLQGPPSAYPYLDAEERALLAKAAPNHAARVVAGHRALAADADDHLGWLALADELHGGFYSVRERSPYKKSFPLDTLEASEHFAELAAQWGMLLASAHARSDKDHRDELIDYSFDKQVARITRGRQRAFCELVSQVARAYARQVSQDHQAFASHVARLGPDSWPDGSR